MELLNIIDESFVFEKETVRILGSYNEPWFVAKDICMILDIKDNRSALRIIPESWKAERPILTRGGQQTMKIINESALYKLIMRCNKPMAQKFQEVVCGEILPSIRKKGEYKLQQSLLEKEKELKYKEYLLGVKEKENKILQSKVERKERKKYEYSQLVYIISNKSIHNCFKIGKTGDLNNRLDNLVSGSPSDYIVEYHRKVFTKLESTAIENMMLIIFDKFRTVNKDTLQKREWVQGVELSVLIKELDIIVNFLNSRKEIYVDKEILENKIVKPEIIKQNNFEITDEDYIEIMDEDVENEIINEDVEEDNESVEEDDEDNVENQIKIDPRNFKSFLDENFELGESYFCPKSDIKDAHRVWSSSTDKIVKKELDDFLKKEFKSGIEFMDNIKRNVYRGLKIKKLEYTPSIDNHDYEQFISNKLGVDFNYRISFVDFFQFFIDFKKESQPQYKLTSKYKKEITNYLKTTFAHGRVHCSTTKKAKALFGVWGLGSPLNNYGLKEVKKNSKKVGQYKVDSDELVQEFESVSFASKKLKIAYSTFTNYILKQNNVDGYIYKYI
jgi:prophage antirepressor-like protein